jgi:Saxitoxin biosynthesis operon protein SxtJ
MAIDRHEERLPERPLPSNRSFGLLFTGVFALAAIWPILSGAQLRLWALGLSALFLFASLLVPDWLTPLNRAWMKLAQVPHRVVSPVVLGAMFYVVIVPIGLAMRVFRRDELKLRFDPGAPSYWEARSGQAFDLESLKQQF